MKIVKEDITQSGLFVLSAPDPPIEATLDIVFVHGLQGHPRNTWETKDKTCFWPLDLLSKSCERARPPIGVRIVSLGYDTVITRGYEAANKSDIFSIARNLLFNYARDRDYQGRVGRPIIFVAHSLGGIIVKDILRCAEHDSEDYIKDVLHSTFAVVFLGTPHRGGSTLANHADVIRATASAVLRIDSNSKVLRALCGADSAELELGRETFGRLWREYNSRVKTFQESKALTGVNIGSFNKLVVPSDSSCIGDDREHKEEIDADHKQMTRFVDEDDQGYQKVSRTLLKFAKDIASQSERLTEAEMECLKTLRFAYMGSRQRQIEPAFQGTCEWLYSLPNFRKWYCRESTHERSILWIKGKPGSGKSVLMKALVQKLQNDRCSSAMPVVSGIHTAIGSQGTLEFFFSARSHRQYDTQVSGLIRTLLYHLFKVDPGIRKLLLRFYLGLQSYGETLGDEELNDFFRETFMQHLYESPLKRIFIFVDALDECRDKDIKHVVRLLLALSKTPEISICLSSRHYPNLELYDTLDVIVEEHNRHDISHYALNAISMKCQDKDSIVEAVTKRADGVFLWASLVLGLVNTDINNDEPSGIVMANLNCLPKTIEGVYSNILQTITDNDRATTTAIILWILLAAEPLTLLELQYALAFTDLETVVDPGESLASVGRWHPRSIEEWKNSGMDFKSSTQFKGWLRVHSRGLVEARPISKDCNANGPDAQIIQFIHDTARTYFLTRHGMEALTHAPMVNILTFNYVLLRACLNYLNIDDFQPVENDEPLLRPPNDAYVEDRLSRVNDIKGVRPGELAYREEPRFRNILAYPFLDYAMTYLFYHFFAIAADDRLHGKRLFVRSLEVNSGRIWRRWMILTKGSELDAFANIEVEGLLKFGDIERDYTRRRTRAMEPWERRRMIREIFDQMDDRVAVAFGQREEQGLDSFDSEDTMAVEDDIDPADGSA